MTAIEKYDTAKTADECEATRDKAEKHTPGPWYARHGQISSLTSPHGCTIANCNRTSAGISDGEVAANARLIAATPDLLGALRELVAWSRAVSDSRCFRSDINSDQVSKVADWRDCIDAARAAIAKATGKQS